MAKVQFYKSWNIEEFERITQKQWDWDNLKVYWAILIHHCPNCGNDMYGEWQRYASLDDFISNEISNAIYSNTLNEIKEFQGIKFCPICNQPLRNDTGYLGQYIHCYFFKQGKNSGISKLNNELPINYEIGAAPSWKEWQDNKEVIVQKLIGQMEEERRKPLVSTCDKKAHDYVDQCNIPYNSTLSNEAVLKIKTSRDELKVYLHHLIKMETGVYSLIQYLTELYIQRDLLEPKANGYKHNQFTNLVLDIHKEQTESTRQEIEKSKQSKIYREIQEKINTIALSFKDIDLEGKPTVPTEPILKKPGLFNKKAVIAENEQLIAQYETAKRAYAEELQKYEARKKQAIKEAQQESIDEAERINNELTKLNNCIEHSKNALSIKQAALEKAKTEVLAVALDETNPAVQAKSLIDNEIRQTEQLLKDTYECRNKLYSYDIVYSKYRDIVALSTFYEYLMAGRCETLEGANGAYNLYENEIRSNLIINQLNQVIVSLDQIKENQYMLYAEINSINNNLEQMNKSMNQALVSIKSMDENLQSISKTNDTIAHNSAVIAHNTEVAAYYSKRTAELTDALGFMVAFS